MTVRQTNIAKRRVFVGNMHSTISVKWVEDHLVLV